MQIPPIFPSDEVGSLPERVIDRLLDEILERGRWRQRRKIGQLDRRRGRDADTLREGHLRVALFVDHLLHLEDGLRRLLSRECQLGTCAESALQAPLRRVLHRAGGIE